MFMVDRVDIAFEMLRCVHDLDSEIRVVLHGAKFNFSFTVIRGMKVLVVGSG